MSFTNPVAVHVLGKKQAYREHIPYINGNRKKIQHSILNISSFLGPLKCGRKKDQEGRRVEIKR